MRALAIDGRYDPLWNRCPYNAVMVAGLPGLSGYQAGSRTPITATLPVLAGSLPGVQFTLAGTTGGLYVPDLPALPGQTWTTIAWLQGAAGTAQARIEWYRDDGSGGRGTRISISSGTVAAVTAGWQAYTVTAAVAPAGTALAVPALYATAAVGTPIAIGGFGAGYGAKAAPFWTPPIP